MTDGLTAQRSTRATEDPRRVRRPRRQLSGGEIALARLIDALDYVDPHVILAEDGPLVAAAAGSWRLGRGAADA